MALITYTRNIQGHDVRLQLIEADPGKLTLDSTNPRLGFSMQQLEEGQRGDAACTLLLTSQEDTEALKRSIVLSGGVQEPVYIRHDQSVAEGNRRVVALRAAKEENPEDERFQKIPAWLIDRDTPESVIQDLLNEIHLGSVRGWAPYEKALQMRALVTGGLIEAEVAERYRMTTREVRQHIEAANLMDRLYFPITDNPRDAEHRSKFSYFLEFANNGRIQAHSESTPNLPSKFAEWVRDGRIDTGMRVRRLPKILDSAEATRLLEVEGFDAAEQFLAEENPREQELYLTLERTRARLKNMTLNEIVQASGCSDRIALLEALHEEVTSVLENVKRVSNSSSRRVEKAESQEAG